MRPFLRTAALLLASVALCAAAALAVVGLFSCLGCAATPGDPRTPQAIINKGGEAAGGAAARVLQGDWAGAGGKLLEYGGWLLGIGTAVGTGAAVGRKALKASTNQRRLDQIAAGAPIRPNRTPPDTPPPPATGPRLAA